MTCGYPSIVAATMQEAEDKLAQLGHEAFALVVIDVGVLSEGGADMQREVHRLLQSFTGQCPALPVVFLGTTLQKYAILAAHPTIVPFMTMPFSPHDLMQTIQPLLPKRKSTPSDVSQPMEDRGQDTGWSPYA